MAARPRGATGVDVSCAHTTRARTLARAVVVGTGLDGRRGGGRARTRSAHHRGVARPLLSRRASKYHLRAERGLPPALNEAQQAELKAAVQASPRAVGIEAADWTWKV